MTEPGSLVNTLRVLAAAEASIPALRASLFVLAVFAAISWQRRRHNAAVVFLVLGGLLGLSYWLIQIVTPLGLGTDTSLTHQWSQAGVNALAEPKGGGFVVGSPAETSLVSVLAAFGAPRGIVFAIPQLVVFMSFGLLLLIPWTLVRNPATAVFATGLVAGCGLWPGLSPFGSLLLHPVLGVMLWAACGILFALARHHRVRKAFHRRRITAALGLIVAGVLALSFQGGGETSVSAALLLAAASIVLASPLRAVLRRTSASAGAARRAEALCLLGVFCGSGLFWWKPSDTIPGFHQAKDSGTTLQKALDWMTENVPANGVILASPAYSASIAALAGRRVLFPPLVAVGETRSFPGSARRARLFESTLRGRPVARLAEAFSVTHLFLGPGEPTPPLPAEADSPDDARLSLVLVYQDVEDFRVFRLARK